MEDWRALAACRGMDPDVFFPGKGGYGAREAKSICCLCPVKAECLELGLREELGVWGGTSVRERRRLRAANGNP